MSRRKNSLRCHEKESLGETQCKREPILFWVDLIVIVY